MYYIRETTYDGINNYYELDIEVPVVTIVNGIKIIPNVGNA